MEDPKVNSAGETDDDALLSPVASPTLKRGRPKKDSGPTKKVAKTASEDEGNESDDAPKRGRGRPPTGKPPKAAYVPTGKARGRPKKGSKPARGRPAAKKAANSDDENDDEEKQVGRPASGGVDLNINRTGRGQGRPKATVAAKKGSTPNGTSDEGSPKKRGRPAKDDAKPAAPYKPTGKSRGRPKASKKEAEEDEASDNDDNDANDNSDGQSVSDE